MLEELLYLFENNALVVSSAKYIACLEPLVTIEDIKRTALIYFPTHQVPAVFQGFLVYFSF